MTQKKHGGFVGQCEEAEIARMLARSFVDQGTFRAKAIWMSCCM